MPVLLSTIGSRGDVEPLLALALELRALGQEARVCALPDFRDWIDSFGIAVVPIGPELRPLTATSAPALPAKPSPEQLRQLAIDSVDAQFSGRHPRAVAQARGPVSRSDRRMDPAGRPSAFARARGPSRRRRATGLLRVRQPARPASPQ